MLLVGYKHGCESAVINKEVVSLIHSEQFSSMLFGLLCLAIYTQEAAGLRKLSEVPEHFQLMVDLYNRLVRYYVSFDYDFGSGVSLINGEASIRIFKSIQLLSHSKILEVERKGILDLKCPLGFQIRPKSGQPGLDLRDCLMELEYTVVSSNGDPITRPTAAWIHSCSSITYLNYTKPQYPDQVLPLLSQAILGELVAQFTFKGFPLCVGFQQLKELYKWILYDGIMDGAIRIEESRT